MDMARASQSRFQVQLSQKGAKGAIKVEDFTVWPSIQENFPEGLLLHFRIATNRRCWPRFPEMALK
jgi:hypothetical protein